MGTVYFITPTERSLRHFREQGYIIDVVERFIPRSIIRRDYLGLIDAIAFHPDKPGVIGVQMTDYTSMSKHVAKAKASANLEPWLRTGDRKFVIQAWRKEDGRLTERWL